MSSPARATFAFGLYLSLLATGMFLDPQLLLSPFGLPVDPLWTRLVGVMVGYVGYYYIQAARTETVAFMRWTVWARATVLPLFAGVVLTGLAKPTLVLFGVVDGLGAWWTWRCLQSDDQRRPTRRGAASDVG